MSIRSERVAGQLMAELGNLITSQLRDPRLSALVTITRVQLTSDLREAVVFVSVMGGAEERESALKALLSATGYLRREVGQRLRLRHVPSLQFKFDVTIEEGDRVLEAIDTALSGARPDESPATEASGG